MSRFALAIGGSDSSGGAGIQADLRAFSYLGIPAATAVTAITAQGVGGVSAVQLVEPEVLEKQIDDAFEMFEIGSVKIGMLGSETQVEAVARALRRQERAFLVLDPVIRSTSGTQLLSGQGIRAMIEELLPMTTLFTPNLDELALIASGPVTTEIERIESAKKLFSKGAKAVLVKGGHLESAPIDILVCPDEAPYCFEGSRVLTEHSRGTGCTLASLIAGHLMLGSPLQEAILLSKKILQAALKYPAVPKLGRGYPIPSADAVHQERVDRISGIYFVTDSRLNPEITHTIGARLALDGGASVVQLREKSTDAQYVAGLAKRLRAIADKRKALFIMNDRGDIAMASGADGVHLGPEDLSPEVARQLLGPEKIIGASVSTVKEAKRIASHCSYLAVGAIFGSSTKGDAGEAVGVDRITEIKAAFPDKKIVAIGGINLSNIASVAAAGADAAAVVSAVVCASDPEQATRELIAEFERGKLLAG